MMRLNVHSRLSAERIITAANMERVLCSFKKN